MKWDSYGGPVLVDRVDVFTETVGLGNRAGVVLDASGLDTAAMQAIAAASGTNETAFGLPATGPDHDLTVRYFSRSRELPLCGHATLAFHYLRARRHNLESQALRIRTGAGILPIDIERLERDHRVVMTLGSPQILETLGPAAVARVCAALGLAERDRMTDLPIQVVTAGHAKVMVPIRRHAALDSLRPDRAALVAIGTGVFVFTLDRKRPDVLYHGRMFAPATGVDEDPVTGNANGPAGYYLGWHGAIDLPPDGVLRYRAVQGEAMGRPGIVEVILHCAGGKIEKIQITGALTIVDR